MVCTVTTSTAAVVTTEVVSLGMIAVVGLISLLVIKELSAATERPRSRLMNQYLDIGIMPLLIVFLFIAIKVLS